MATASSSSQRSYLTLDDLYQKFSPSGYPPLRPPPRVKRLLSLDDLRERFNKAKSPHLSELGPPSRQRGKRPEPSAPPPPPSPPAKPSPPTRPTLSSKLPDPPVFTDTNSHLNFDEWKLRILDKLEHNGDHYPSKSFKIAYVATRLSGKAARLQFIAAGGLTSKRFKN